MRLAPLPLAVAAAVPVGVAPAHGASLTLRPAAAPPGAQVWVQGTGFHPGAPVVLRLAGIPVARPRADRAGRVRAELVLPPGPAGRRRTLAAGSGRRRVRAVLDTLSGPPSTPAPVEVALSGGARLRVDSAASPGANLTVAASGLPAAAPVTLAVSGAPATPVTLAVSGAPATPVTPAVSGAAAAATTTLAVSAAGTAAVARTSRDGRLRARLRLPAGARPGTAAPVSLRAGGTRVRARVDVVGTGTRAPALPPSRRPAPLMVAVGDIACRPGALEGPTVCHHDATGRMVAGTDPEVVAPLGDLQYERGAFAEWASYDASWGFARSRTRPAVGNHEYKTPGATPYYRYFGALAGHPARGYYSYELGRWHVVVLNSNCRVVGCARGGAQERWLRADLRAHPAACTLAYTHHPRWSSGTRGGRDDRLGALWNALYDHRAELFLAGHDHIYERMAPLDRAGRVDRTRGVRPFVVGTGGRGFSLYRARAPGRERTHGRAFGILLLSLKPRAYSFYFAAQYAHLFRDTGGQSCH